MQSSTRLIQTVLRAVPHLPRPAWPPAEHAEWWERGVLDGVETMKAFTQAALATIEEAVEQDEAAAREVVADLGPLFSTSGARRADGRLDEVWITRGYAAENEE